MDDPDPKVQTSPPRLPNELISRVILELQKEQKYQNPRSDGTGQSGDV
jgi:hypothetical protein